MNCTDWLSFSYSMSRTRSCKYCSEGSCSVTMSDLDAVPQYCSFVTMLGEVGATRPNYCIS